jgi:hypothetical protein
MIPVLRAALCALVLLQAPAAVAETRFLAAFEDIPLAPGLGERAEAAFVFVAAEGRIAEAMAAGRNTEGAVRAYYGGALPALGWAAEGADSFVRGRERLTLAYATGSDGALTVRFRLVARPASLALD